MDNQEPVIRDLGLQPIDALLSIKGLSNHDIVEASPTRITHKMVARARKGRRLTPKSKKKILAALNAAVPGREFGMLDLFNYTEGKEKSARKAQES